ncbi:unnamed protein product, partial [marine sediment metagenome]
PFPIPRPKKAFRMGTSVKVAKYIKAPATEAMKLDLKAFPPTQVWIT